MRLAGNEEDKMKRISHVLFLTLASAVALHGQTSFAQSNETDLAPGPIAELLPENDVPAVTGFDYPDRLPSPNRLSPPDRPPAQSRTSMRPRSTGYQVLESNSLPESNALPPASSQQNTVVEPLAENALPLFDTPAQPRSSDDLISLEPPQMPASQWTTPRTPGLFHTGNAFKALLDQPDTNEVPAAEELNMTAEACNCQSEIVIEGDCGCDTCDTCDTCDAGNEVIYVEGTNGEGCENYASDDCYETEEQYYETGADRIDNRASSESNRRRGHKGIFGRHRAKHQARKENRARRNQDEERYIEEDQYVSYEDQACDIDDGCGAEPPVIAVDQGHLNGSGVNTMIGVSGLYFGRNYGSDQQFSSSRFVNERGLFSNDADHDNFYGFDANLTRRKANGNGFEARYFGLEPNRATQTLGGGPFTTLGITNFGDPAILLSGVGVFGAPNLTAAEIFDYADVHQVTRETSIHNAELNLLRLGRTGQRKRGAGRTVSHEYLFGFRYFKFDESFGYNAQAFRAGNPASHLLRAEYLNEVTNSLYGAQIGGRTEIGFLRKFSLIIGTKAGIFNNRFTNNQNVTLSPRGGTPYAAQVLDGPYSGEAFDTQGKGSDVTMLGELDLGLTYRVFRNSRLRVGYRALFVSDVAFAVPQTELFFSDLNAVRNPTANDDLVLHGGYFGMEFAF